MGRGVWGLDHNLLRKRISETTGRLTGVRDGLGEKRNG